MLTSYQCEVVAYIGYGDVYCPDCAKGIDLGEGSFSDHGIIRYTADEEWPGGLSCGECGTEIVEPCEDYCSEHDSWRAWEDGSQRNYCEQAPTEDGVPQSDDCTLPELAA